MMAEYTTFNDHVLEVGDKVLMLAGGSNNPHFEYRYIHSIDPLKTAQHPTLTFQTWRYALDVNNNYLKDANDKLIKEYYPRNTKVHKFTRPERLFFIESGKITGERLSTKKRKSNGQI